MIKLTAFTYINLKKNCCNRRSVFKERTYVEFVLARKKGDIRTDGFFARVPVVEQPPSTKANVGAIDDSIKEDDA